MKPKSFLRYLLALAGSSLLAISSASAITFTWTQNGTGSQTWGTTTNWLGSNVFVSGSANELAFSFTGVAGNATVVTGVPSALSMNVLTLAGTGPNSTSGSSILIGDNTTTWTIGDGTTSTVNLTSTLGGGSSDRDIRYTIAANLELNGGTSGITTFTGNSTSGTGAVFSGNITETGSGKGITKSGSSLLIFSGNNSYTGTTLVSAGTLRLNSATALSGGLGATGGTSALTISGSGVVELGASNFQRNLGTGSNQFQMTAGGTNISGFSAFGGPRVITVNNDASQELVWGSGGFNPGILLLNAATANDSLELTNKIDLAGSARTFQVNANKALLSGVIRNGNLVKTGTGTLVLTGSNTYGGNNTLTGGTLSISAADNVGTTGNISFNGGTLQIRGTTLTSFASIGSHNVTFSANNTGIDIQDAANIFTADEAINLGNKAFTKLGAGTLVLNFDSNHGGGAASTTSVSGGGTLVLDYSTNNGSKLADSSGAVTLGGTNLILRGGSHAEVVASIVLAVTTGNSISRDGSSTATLANAGGLTIGSLSNLTIAEAGIVSTTNGNVNGIQTNGQVTVGSHFAANVSNVLQAYGSYTTATTAGGGAITVVNQLTGGGNMSGTLNSYALRIVNSGGSSNVLELGSNSLNMANGGTVLYAGASSSDNYTINGTSGQVKTNNGNQPLNINVFNGTLTVNANLGVTGSGSFAKAGAGTLVVGGSYSSTVATYIQQGVLRAANNNALGNVAGGTIVQAGAALELSQTTALTPLDITIGAEALSINGVGISNGGALRNHSGSNTYGGLITIGASGARINANAVSSLTLTGGIATTLTQDVTIGGAGNTTVSTTAISGSGNLIKDGAGTLTLSATNTYTGTTTVGGGAGSKLIVNGNISTSVLTTVQTGATLGGSGTVGALTINSGGIFSPGNSPGITTVNGNYIQNGTLQVEIEGGTAGNGNGFHDQVVVNGTVTLNGLLSLTAFSGTYAENNLLFILLNDGTDAISGTFTGLAQGASVGTYAGFDWQISYTGDSTGPAFTGGNDVVLRAVTAIPEPSAALLGALGLLMLLRRRRG